MNIFTKMSLITALPYVANRSQRKYQMCHDFLTRYGVEAFHQENKSMILRILCIRISKLNTYLYLSVLLIYTTQLFATSLRQYHKLQCSSNVGTFLVVI